MKQLLCLFLLLIIAGPSCTGQAQAPAFQVFTFDEATSLFILLGHFDEAEAGADTPAPQIEKLLQDCWSGDSVTDLFLQAYFRESKNTNVRNIVTSYISSNSLSDPLSQSILMRYAAKELTKATDESQSFSYSYRDAYFDENILMHCLSEVKAFDSHLILYLPQSDWASIGLNNGTSAKGAPEKDQLSLISGGNTTALSVAVKRESLPSKTDYVSLSQNLLRKANVYDLTNQGVVAKNNADRTFLTLEDAGDQIVIAMALYSGRYKEKYTIRLIYNISPLNMNYRLFDRLKKQLIDIALLAYVNE